MLLGGIFVFVILLNTPSYRTDLSSPPEPILLSPLSNSKGYPSIVTTCTSCYAAATLASQPDAQILQGTLNPINPKLLNSKPLTLEKPKA